MAEKAFDFTPYEVKGLTYNVYLDLIKDLLTENRTTGPEQTEELVHYTKLNVQRMERIYKTAQILPELEQKIKAINAPQIWVAISEAWCGDAAQNIPLFQRLAELNAHITFKIVLRDENPELMERYLTNGAKAIPIVFALSNGKQIWKWGPRPVAAQDLVIEFKKKQQGTVEDMKTQLHTWYAHNKTIDQQHELLKLI